MTRLGGSCSLLAAKGRDTIMPLVNGSKLTDTTKRLVLDAYGYRWTVENKTRARQWLRGQVPTIPPVPDSEWLANHAFYVKQNGELDGRYGHCEPACMADDWQPAAGQAT